MSTTSEHSGDDAKRRWLPIYVRYDDLNRAGIVGSWTQLLRTIEDEGFPTGVMLSPNIRAWRLDEVEAWLATRPTARKIPPPARKPRGRKKKIAQTTQAAEPEAANDFRRSGAMTGE